MKRRKKSGIRVSQVIDNRYQLIKQFGKGGMGKRCFLQNRIGSFTTGMVLQTGVVLLERLTGVNRKAMRVGRYEIQ